MDESQAELYLQSLQDSKSSQSLSTPTSLSLEEDLTKDLGVRQNERIIKEADLILLERLEARDPSLRVGDIIQAKSEAFKEINHLVDPNE